MEKNKLNAPTQNHAVIKSVSAKEAMFLEAYIKSGFNGTRAYLKINPKASWVTANSEAAKFLKRPQVLAFLRDLTEAATTSAEQAMAIISDQARGSLEDFLDDANQIDLGKARELGVLHLVKKIRQRTITHEDKSITSTELELYDAQAANALILKATGKVSDAPTIVQQINLVTVRGPK